MNNTTPKTATGGETIYRNNKRFRFILGLPIAIAFFAVILYVFRAEFEPWVIVLALIVLMVDLVILVVFIGKSPDIVLSPRYFGFTRYFGVYRIRWDRIKQVETAVIGGINRITITFLNDKGEGEKLTFNPRDYSIGESLVAEIKRLRAGGY